MRLKIRRFFLLLRKGSRPEISISGISFISCAIKWGYRFDFDLEKEVYCHFRVIATGIDMVYTFLKARLYKTGGDFFDSVSL